MLDMQVRGVHVAELTVETWEVRKNFDLLRWLNNSSYLHRSVYEGTFCSQKSKPNKTSPHSKSVPSFELEAFL